MNIFDEYCDKYDNWYDKHYDVYMSELKALEEIIPSKGCGIEIGVGTGRFAKALNIEYGIDISQAMLAMAKERGVKTICAKAEEMPFNENYFDYALMMMTICFLPEPLMSLRECYRVLKPKGEVIVGIIDKDSIIGEYYLKNKNKSVFYKDANLYTVLEVLEYMQKAGFKNFKFRQTLFKPLDETKDIESSLDGYGQGSFVAISGTK